MTSSHRPHRDDITSSRSQSPHHSLDAARNHSFDTTLRRRRPTTSSSSLHDHSTDDLRRRSSNVSDYSVRDVRRTLSECVLDPNPESDQSQPEMSSWALVPLAFALLPAIGGVFFTNGSAVITDVLLLGLAAVFLRWSVTQPWKWYYSAQEVRVMQEAFVGSAAYESESEALVPPASPSDTQSSKKKQNGADQENYKQDNESNDTLKTAEQATAAVHTQTINRQGAALRELYFHEVFALLFCFLAPVLSAYLLHIIRAQLNRPSEGLVSNYHLTIFLLASEVRPCAHLIKLVRARTLHLHRVIQTTMSSTVHRNNGIHREIETQLQELTCRIETLEVNQAIVLKENTRDPTNPIISHEAIVRDACAAIRPDLDALTRAVRRYEKRTALFTSQTNQCMSDMNARIDDAISLVTSTASADITVFPAFFGWVGNLARAIVLLPTGVAISLVLLPLQLLVHSLRQDPMSVSRRSRTQASTSVST